MIEPSTPISLDPGAQEAADRAAIEAQWVQFWQVYPSMVRTPADQRPALLDTVVVEPLKSNMLESATRFEAEGIDYFGSVVSDPYWVTGVNGLPYAVMRDCLDQSNYGSIWVAPGQKRTVGTPKNSMQAGFVRGEDGVWRVQSFNHLGDIPC